MRASSLQSCLKKGIGGNYYMETYRRNRRCVHRLYDPNLKKGLVVIFTWKPVGD